MNPCTLNPENEKMDYYNCVKYLKNIFMKDVMRKHEIFQYGKQYPQ